MKKLMTLILIVTPGWVGWAIGEKIGIMTAYFLGCIGSSIGLYLGGRVRRMIE